MFRTIGTTDALSAWSTVNGAQISVVNSIAPLSQALPNSLEVVVPSATSSPLGVANAGYFGALVKPKSRVYALFHSSTGINVDQSWTYNASFFYKFAGGSTFNGNLTASLISSSGNVLASASLSAQASTATDWTEFFVQLKPTASASDINNTFRVTLDGDKAAGDTAFFSLFSLFPPTFKNRPNGIRVDLAQACTTATCVRIHC